MIEGINNILDLIIKVSIVSGIFLLIYFYWKIRILNTKIENLIKDFEIKRNKIRQEPIAMPHIDLQTENEKRKMEEAINPLERERKRLLTKIPFLK